LEGKFGMKFETKLKRRLDEAPAKAPDEVRDKVSA